MVTKGNFKHAIFPLSGAQVKMLSKRKTDMKSGTFT
jgi:hypothetical protein